jgi:hypothetical protein
MSQPRTLSHLARHVIASIGRGLLWLLLAVAFGVVEVLVQVTEFAANRLTRRENATLSRVRASR